MARISFNQIDEYKQSGGGNYFKLANGQEAVVRILYNTIENAIPLVVHEVRENGGYATVDCPREPGAPLDECVYCAAQHKPVVRVVIPLYNETTKQIEYWTKSGQWVQDTLKPMTDEVEKLGKPIASQQYKIKRIGEKLDTKYTLIPVGQPDNMTAESFGQIKDPVTDLKMIKEANYRIPVQQNNQQQYGQPQYGQQPQQYNAVNNQPNMGYGQPQYGQPQATRKTVDMFN